MPPEFRARRDTLLRKIGKPPVVMGILNLTPDSFFDGGKFDSAEAALSHAREMIAAGGDIVDVGGESTRPGAAPLDAGQELARVEPVLAKLADIDTPISIDTNKAVVAERATQLGAVMVNDVWGLQKDPAMADTVARAEAALVLMHNRTGKDENLDIIADMRRFFDHSLDLAAKAGISNEFIVLDPGVGFGKTSRQNRDAVFRLHELRDYGLPLLVGLSRKGFLGSLAAGVERSLEGTIAANLAAAANGATIFRVHDVAEHVATLNVLFALQAGRLGV
jgi:dihydropteroate synthase